MTILHLFVYIGYIKVESCVRVFLSAMSNVPLRVGAVVWQPLVGAVEWRVESLV